MCEAEICTFLRQMTLYLMISIFGCLVSLPLVESAVCVFAQLAYFTPPGALAVHNFSPTTPVLGDPFQLLPAQPRLRDNAYLKVTSLGVFWSPVFPWP